MVLVAVAGVLILVASTAHDFDAARRTAPEASFFPAPSERPSASTGEAQNILLLGTDTRGSAPRTLAGVRAQRSDTMLLVHVPGDRTRVTVMSLMRDSWVSIPGHGMGKLNAALSYGGVPLTVRTVEGLLGVRIDHVAIVSFEGFVGMTDALGGVTVENRIAFENLGHRFASGPIRLRGAAALAYVRARYPFEDGDFQRVRNQRAYLDGVVRSLLGAGPLEARAAIRTVAPYLLTDPGLDSGYLGALAVSLRGLRSKDLVGFTVPTSGTGTEGGQSVVRLDEASVADLGQHLRNDTMASFDRCRVSLC